MPASRFAPYAAVAVLAGIGGSIFALELQSDPPPAAAAAAATSSRQAVSNPAGGESAAQIYSGAKDAVAHISAQTAEGTATGTGFVISKDGDIVTNAHVVDGAQQVAVSIGENGEQREAQVVGVSASNDLALLKVDADDLPTVSLGDSSKVGVGDSVFAIGNPYGLDHTLTSGIVSAVGRDIQAPDGATISGVIQTDAALNPGNSGGPLFNTTGDVIGVNSQIATGSQSGSGTGGNVGIGFAIPASTVKQVVAQLKAGGGDTHAQTEQQQVDPYEQQQADPYEEQSDPYEQVDPYTDPRLQQQYAIPGY